MPNYKNDINSEAVQTFIKSQGLELKKFHALGGPIHETVAFNAELHKDGKAIAFVNDDGNGGGVYLNTYYNPSTKPETTEIEAALEEAAIVWFVSKYETTQRDKAPINWDLESLVEEMAMNILEEKEWKTKTRTKIFVRTSYCGEGEYYVYQRKAKVSDKIANAMREKAIVEMACKRFGINDVVEIRGLRTIEDWRTLATK